jgi:hypothetical protein
MGKQVVIFFLFRLLMKMVKAKKDIVGGPHLYKKYISFCYSLHALSIYEKMPPLFQNRDFPVIF